MIKLSQQSIYVIIYRPCLILWFCSILNYFQLFDNFDLDLLSPFFALLQVIYLTNMPKSLRSFVIFLVDEASFHHPPPVEHPLRFFAISGHLLKEIKQIYITDKQKMRIYNRSINISSGYIKKYQKMLHEDRHGNGIRMKKQTQQQQLQEILNQTFKSSGYCDEDIGQFIHDKSGNYQEMFNKQKFDKRDGNNLSIFNRKPSESQSDGLSASLAYRQSFGSVEDHREDNISEAGSVSRKLTEKQQADEIINSLNSNEQSDRPQCFIKLDKYYQNKKKVLSLSQIKEKYPYFVISNPNYTLNKSYEQNLFQYNTLKSVNIEAMDVGFCTIADNYKVCIGTDDGRVAIFEKTYSKPVNIFQAFSVKKKKQSNQNFVNQIPKISAIKWSQNLQYLAIGSSTRQLKVYQFKQTIVIENRNILRVLKQPIQIISLTEKQIKNTINSIRFISQIPFLAILNDLNDDMQMLEYKMHIMNYRPYLTHLPIKFNDVFSVELMNFTVGHKVEKNQIKAFNNNQDDFFISANNKKSQTLDEQGTLIAIGSEQYVTIALLKPYFEVIMVYDKEKHGKNIKKEGYSHISFRKSPLGILIVWDKYAQLLNIQIQSLSPLKSKINNSGCQLMPETTLLAGLITDTLVYQLSESGLKIYATANFGEQKNSTEYKECIYEHFINFFELPSGLQIQQELTQSTPTLSLIRMLSSYIKCCNGWIFITSNTSLLGVRIQKFDDLIRNTIQNINNWKIGLQLLHDGYKGLYKNYDNMTMEVIVKNIHEYTFKYINFLNMVIGNVNGQVSQKQKQNKKELWYQQITFLLNILIETNQFEYIFNKILPKLINSNLQEYINCLEPFIMLHKIRIINQEGLSILFKYINNKQSISNLLIANVLPQCNQIDLPHMLNNIILQNSMFEDMAFINMLFEDFFTAFAVMVSYYRALSNRSVLNTEQKNNHPEILLELKKKNSQNQKEEQNIQGGDEVENIRNKSRIRQLIVYFNMKILSKINGNEFPSHFSALQRKKQIQKFRQFLQVFLPLFQSSIIYIILDAEQTEKILFQHILPQMFTGHCLQIINAISNKCFNTDLMTDIVLGIPVDKVRDMSTYWMCLIGLYNKSVIKIDVFLGLRYLVNESKTLQSKCASVIVEQKKQVRSERLKKTGLNEYQIKKKKTEEFVRQTVEKSTHKINEQFKKISPQVLQTFYNQLLSDSMSFESSHISLLRILSLILGSGFYIKVIHAMMVEKQSIKEDKKELIEQKREPYSVYNYIEQTVKNYNKTEKQQLRRIIYENIQYFIQLDSEKLCDIIIDYYLESIDKYVSYCLMSMSINSNARRSQSLQNYNGIMIGSSNSVNLNNNGICVHQHLLIKLIEGILLRLQKSAIQNLRIDKFQPNSEWMLELRLKYLRLLAVTGRQNQIIEEVKKQNYPLDSSLEICRQYGVLDAQAYLLVKSGGQGEIASAIRLYFTLVSEKIKFLTPESLEKFKDYFISILRQCIRVCESLQGSEHFNEEWFMISEQLNDLKLGIYRILPAYTCDLLCDIINKQVYPILSEKIVRKESCDGIINYFQQNMQNLDLVFIRALLHEIIKNYAFHKVMYLLTQQSYITSQIKWRRDIVTKTNKGFVTSYTCCLCHEDNGILIHYNNCGHQIHPSCGQDVKICVICSCRQQKLIEKQIDLLKKIKPELYSQDNELPALPEIEVKKQNRTERLKKFDEVKIDIVYV